MKAEAIIFDKDGTLLDFDAFWISVTVKALEDVFQALSMDDSHLPEIMEALGVRDGVTDMDGALCKGTYEEIGHIVYDVLSQYGCPISKDAMAEMVLSSYNKNVDAGQILPTCAKLQEVLTALKEQGKILALVTTDNPLITEKCLRSLGIYPLFDKIYTDDGKTPTKPDPYCANALCALLGLNKQNVVMVGDTLTDMRFAKNAGIAAVGLARTEKNAVVLSTMADAVIDDMTQLPDAISSL